MRKGFRAGVVTEQAVRKLARHTDIRLALHQAPDLALTIRAHSAIACILRTNRATLRHFS